MLYSTRDEVIPTPSWAKLRYSIPSISDQTDQLGGLDRVSSVGIAELPSVSTAEAVAKFLAAKRAAARSQATLRSYRDALRPFARHYPTLPAKPEQIEEYLILHRGNGTTVRNIYVVLRLFYNWASARMGVPNPMTSVEKPRSKPKSPEHLTQAQAMALLDAIETDRERGLVYCFLGLGLRLSEARRLRAADIGEDTILIRGKERDEPMPLLAEIRESLLELTKGKRPEEPVFVGQGGQPLSDSMVQLMIKRLFARAGIKGVRSSPHILRHSRGVISNMAGLDSYSSRRLLRHANTEMTDRYSELNLEELRLKEERYNPLRVLANLGKKPDCAQCQPYVEVAPPTKDPYTEAEQDAGHNT